MLPKAFISLNKQNLEYLKFVFFKMEVICICAHVPPYPIAKAVTHKGAFNEAAVLHPEVISIMQQNILLNTDVFIFIFFIKFKIIDAIFKFLNMFKAQQNTITRAHIFIIDSEVSSHDSTSAWEISKSFL